MLSAKGIDIYWFLGVPIADNFSRKIFPLPEREDAFILSIVSVLKFISAKI